MLTSVVHLCFFVLAPLHSSVACFMFYVFFVHGFDICLCLYFSVQLGGGTHSGRRIARYRGKVRNVVSTRFSAAAMVVKGRAITYSIPEENEEEDDNEDDDAVGSELGERPSEPSPRYATAVDENEGLDGLEVSEANEGFPDAPYAGQIDTVIDDPHDHHADTDDEDGNGDDDDDDDEDSEEEEVGAVLLDDACNCM